MRGTHLVRLHLREMSRQTDPYGQKADWQLPGAGGGESSEGRQTGFLGADGIFSS